MADPEDTVDEAGTAREEAPQGESRAEIHPRPLVNRITQGRVLWLMLAGLLGLLYLTVHYAHRSLGPEVEKGASAPGQRPLDPGFIQRLGNEARARAQEAPPLPPPPVSPPPSWQVPDLAARRRREARERIFSAPLGGPSHQPAGRISRSQTAAGGDVLAELDRRLGEQASQAGFSSAMTSGGAAASALPPAREAHLAAAHRYELATGTAIPAVLLHRLDSDVAGVVRAQVSRDVYDSGAASAVLIPRGTLALGEQVGRPSLGDSRLVLRWTRLRYPDGRTLELGDQAGASADGSLGLPGRVDQHWGGRFGAAILLSLVGAGVQLSQPQRSAVGGIAPSEGQIAAGELGRNLGQLSTDLLRRHLDQPPTIELRPGARLSIVLVQDLVFDEPPAIPN
jgi:type IV secretory pathway VirB10-like protein